MLLPDGTPAPRTRDTADYTPASASASRSVYHDSLLCFVCSFAGANNCQNFATSQQSPIDIVFGPSAASPVLNNAVVDASLPASLSTTYPPTTDYLVRL